MTASMKFRRRRPLATLVVCVAGVWVLVLGVVGLVSNIADRYTGVQSAFDNVQQGELPGMDLAEDMQSWKGRRPLSEHKEDLNCTPRSIEHFPGDFMTGKQRRDGGVVAHVVISIYIFAALAIVCDDYFVASLEVICDVLKLQPDVAGATFMAAGSSAPELFTSVVGVFLAKSDVGVGTIVGSAVFNILFIVAMCGLGAGMVIHLTWWPMTRDCVYYTISVVALVIVIHDEQVHWYESTIMLVMYAGYILIMYFNPRLGDYLTHKVNTFQDRKNPEKKNMENGDIKEDNILTNESEKKKFDEAQDQQEKKKSQESLSVHQEDEGESEEFESPLSWPDTWAKRFFWVVMFPINLVYIITIPDCRRPGCWRKLFMVTFVMSIVWIAGLTYLMVWMVTIIGDTLGIPDTVMGLTLLAAGTSVPDALASLFVARDGLGDMAVSNSIGSNVFDILIGLGLPWLLHSAVVTPGAVVWINSGGMTFSAITLIGTVLFLLIAVAINKWRLTKVLGVICILVYAVFVTFAILYELNVFMDVNPPACPRKNH